MRVAAIDCGTNTILLLVAGIEAGRARPLVERAEIVRLGEGLDQSGELKPEAMARTLAVLGGYVTEIAQLGGARVLAVATEAVRGARNGADFVRQADGLLAAAGGRLEIIGGEREAALAWRAMRGSFPDLAGPRTVIDIGGGSTELIVGEGAIEQVVSLPIGSVRLTERLLRGDPPGEDEKRALVETIDRALDGAPAPRGTLVGTAGTVTTLAAMAQGLTSYDPERVHGRRLSSRRLGELVRLLGDMPLADRRRAPGLEPKRADVIYAGAVLLERIAARAGATEVLVSDRGVRWGLVYEAAGIG